MIGSCNNYYGDCHHGISGWIAGDPIFSWAANIVIGIVLVGLLIWLGNYLFVIRRRPFCEGCRKQGRRTRTIYKGERNIPLCYPHLIDERGERAKLKAANEPAIYCPRHNGVSMPAVVAQVGDQFIVINKCPEGCQFHDDDETEQLEGQARQAGYDRGYSAGSSSSSSTGLAQGIAIGMIIGN